MTRLRHRQGRPPQAVTATMNLSRSRDVDRASAIRALTMGEATIYAVQLPDGTIKIGCSEHLDQRRRMIASGAEVLGFMPGNLADEAAIHKTLAMHRVRGREYYHPSPPVMAVVNEMRDRFNLPRLVS